VADVRRSLTPQLHTDRGKTALLLIDLGADRNRLGGSALAQVYGSVGDVAPDLDDAGSLKTAFAAVRELVAEGNLLAYHDRSDGGLLVTVAEMAFAGHCGVELNLDALPGDAAAVLFNEELGMVLQVPAEEADDICESLVAEGLRAVRIGAPKSDGRIRVTRAGETLLEASRAELQRLWSRTSYEIARLRDDPDCAREEYEQAGAEGPGLSVHLRFDPSPAAAVATHRPRVAILREQGVNSHAEMAWAFDCAGFESVDVHMSDILEGRVTLEGFSGVVACGGFSYGDVLGAGQGWAKSIEFNTRAREQFAAFFQRPDRFALGVCNGCQMFAALKGLVPGAEHWPAFRRNRSEQFEARWTMVEVTESRSLFFQGMAGSRLPIAVAHGEGRAVFDSDAQRAALQAGGQVAMRFVDNHGTAATRYPQNPNGSPDGITSVCNADGRITILMPHPERTVSPVVGSWWPQPWHDKTPWFELFVNARKWVG
jgi:phosphoribosylformylglycinamidine synthase